mmetsp:Transcript_5975/g.20345  ORF Transcript_5975/g.20345 Transcript_5975/m.20345 type:complete len:283 (-) Transcript_5975:180-1028(-)|eukprot:CAMPEP_0182857254 /NCGR_PEP_ID=MMETSP0034_2-20130328/2938_1 /TAXON_ID=156128 /ORGANISM="Nephroselmis pyriformis, Strain CCMP717" /LENGTH=282 /DNA_ID=CAMNT_0024988467 /DNA_START=453 /DNA_END=1301 /DNA_ORIENTATION=-
MSAAPRSDADEARAFLQESFGATGREVPPWEEDEATVRALCDLARKSRERTARAKALAAHYRKLSEEYLHEGARVMEVLRKAGVSESQLSHPGRASVLQVARTAADLGLTDTKASSFLSAISSLSSRLWEHEDDVALYEGRARRLGEATGAAAGRHEELVSAAAALEVRAVGQAAAAAEQRSQMALFQQKEEQYHAQLSNYRQAVKQVGATAEIRHGALVERAEHREGLEAKLAPLRAELAGYGDLPPDKLQAREVVEGRRKRLQALQGQLEDVLGGALLKL